MPGEAFRWLDGRILVSPWDPRAWPHCTRLPMHPPAATAVTEAAQSVRAAARKCPGGRVSSDKNMSRFRASPAIFQGLANLIRAVPELSDRHRLNVGAITNVPRLRVESW